MNEARCLGDLPAGPNCVPGTELLTKWYKQQSDFVRSLYIFTSFILTSAYSATAIRFI